MLAFAPGFGVELAPVGAYQVIEVLGHVGIEIMFLRLGRLVVPVGILVQEIGTPSITIYRRGSPSYCNGGGY
jgi:hypothetical protein